MPSEEPDERYLTAIAVGSAVVNVVAFTVVGELAIEDAVYGGVAGVFAGVGTYLFLPWFMRLSAIQNGADGDLPLSEAIERTSDSVATGTFGLGLEVGAILMLALGLRDAEPSLVVGTAVGVAAGVTVYGLGSVVLDR